MPAITFAQINQCIAQTTIGTHTTCYGYLVDFDEAMSRGRMYGDFERHAYETTCNLFQKEVQ